MFDPDDVLEPVPGESRCGRDLQSPTRAPEIWDVLEALNTARRAEDDPARKGDWQAVQDRCTQILAGVSKDMEVAAALAETLTHTAGLGGLTAGAQVIAGLAERFWDGLFAAPGPDGETGTNLTRLHPVGQLVNDERRLVRAVRRVELFSLDDGTAFTYEDCKTAREWAALRPEDRAKRHQNLPPADRAEREKTLELRSWALAERDFRGDPDGVIAQMAADAAAARDAWRALAVALEARTGNSLVDCGALLALLAEILGLAEALAPAAGRPAAAQAEGAAAEATPMPDRPAPGPVPAVPDRAGALRQLADIAAFFRRTEPHSPIAYTLEETVRRAGLDWPAWLAEAVPDVQQRNAVLLRLGLRPDPPAG